MSCCFGCRRKRSTTATARYSSAESNEYTHPPTVSIRPRHTLTEQSDLSGKCLFPLVGYCVYTWLVILSNCWAAFSCAFSAVETIILVVLDSTQVMKPKLSAVTSNRSNFSCILLAATSNFYTHCKFCFIADVQCCCWNRFSLSWPLFQC